MKTKVIAAFFVFVLLLLISGKTLCSPRFKEKEMNTINQTIVPPKVLLIHGFTGNGNGAWFPWLKAELESRGYEVFAPDMPNASHPELEEWLSALDPYMEKLGPNDIIIGHSLGGKAFLHAILRAHKKIGRTILVAAAIGGRSEKEWKKMEREWKDGDVPALRKFWNEKISLEDISQFTEVTAIFSDDDFAVPLCPREFFPKEWKYEVWHGFGHFLDPVIPKLLEEVNK